MDDSSPAEQVTLDPRWNKPRCRQHNAMNCLNAERTIWRCLACGRSCYDLDNHVPVSVSPAVPSAAASA